MIDFWVVEYANGGIICYTDLDSAPAVAVKRAIWIRRPYHMMRPLTENKKAFTDAYPSLENEAAS